VLGPSTTKSRGGVCTHLVDVLCQLLLGQRLCTLPAQQRHDAAAKMDEKEGVSQIEV
jgi:hypothetical protein